MKLVVSLTDPWAALLLMTPCLVGVGEPGLLVMFDCQGLSGCTPLEWLQPVVAVAG